MKKDKPINTNKELTQEEINYLLSLGAVYDVKENTWHIPS
jgi:hypothetical protein